ncbi:glycosyltransferase [Snodgrassella alvi]|uniref:Glycosyl transferase n=1 Tax=Snodgrassella alvi TaxID=1196083 RepID=A0A2N9XVT6_9NEIS|nr:glycosyltransferase [Snodgrassella alvi]PIT53676.1 glycosyl transferase [Snodgrassella alvi]
MSNDVIKVFVGCDPNNCDLEQMMVVDYSIHKHTSRPVEIVWMQLSHDPDSPWYSDPQSGAGWHTAKWATPFSGFRWGIPAICNYQGRAIYMDADVIVLADLATLWEHPIKEGAVVAAKEVYDQARSKNFARFCTCVWDCAKAKSVLPDLTAICADTESHRKLMTKFKQHPEWIQAYNDSWNCVDGEGLSIEQIKILHYSDMGTQFSHKYSIPRLAAVGQKHWFDSDILPHPREDLSALFDQYYQEALDAGYKLENYAVEPFGTFPKESQAGYKGNDVTRPKKSFLSRIWNCLTGNK